MMLPLDTPTILKTLAKGTLKLSGQFAQGSNYTFLGEVEFEEWRVKAVYKPTRGEQPLWDFPAGSLAKREVAAYRVSEALGWNLVPPTIYRKQAPLGPGSLQQYIEHDPNNHYFNLTPAEIQCLRPVAVFDLLINNADRKSGHILRADDGHIFVIDHGICFHTEDKLRTVLWDFAGETIPTEMLVNLRHFVEQLEDPAGSQCENLVKYIRLGEVRALSRRGQEILEYPVFPSPPPNRRAYPWPPV